MVMESYFACPVSCPITADGLCSSQGTCEYDSPSQTAYCKCNSGYTGDDCGTYSIVTYIPGVNEETQDWMVGESYYYAGSTTASLSTAFFFGLILAALVTSVSCCACPNFLQSTFPCFFGPRNRFEYQAIPQSSKEDVVSAVPVSKFVI